MKKLLFLFLLCPLVFSCNDKEKNPDSTDEVQMEKSTPADTSDSETPEPEIVDEAATEKDGVQTETEGEEPEVRQQQTPAGLSGKYRHLDPDEPGNCDCNCIEVSYTTPTELCISRDQIYITGRYTRTSNTKANLYFHDVVRSETPDREIPWKDFDKNTPIATLTQQPDGSVKLDWLGFAIDGEIAVDYAIYGKKTLEGQYQKY